MKHSLKTEYEKTVFPNTFLTSCSASPLQNSKAEFSQTRPNWVVVVANQYSRIARVSATGITPDGEAQTFLKILCASKENKEFDTTFEYIVSNPDKIPSFNFYDFESSSASKLEVNTVEIRAFTPKGSLDWQFAASGSFQGYAETIAFVFSPDDKIDKNKAADFAKVIVEGSTEVTITVHDNRDNQKVIKTTFPAIGPSSEVAKTLNGCRK